MAVPAPARVELIPVPGLPHVEPGDDLSQVLITALVAADVALVPGDIVVVAQKIVSKAEGRYARLDEVQVTDEAVVLARAADKDPRLAQLILDESRSVLRVRPGVIIVEHNNGYIHANAGIDRSNIASDPASPRVLLLPLDPDQSAAQLRLALQRACGIEVAVVINDSFGRAWRNGTVGVAIGTAGIDPLDNRVGDLDLFGNVLEVTEPAVADELAAAASLVMGQADEGCPVVVVRGFTARTSAEGSASLLRDPARDMFR